MAEELLVTLNRGDSSGFGFSLLGTAGLPHVIYDIVENSPAAKSGKASVEILHPNDEDEDVNEDVDEDEDEDEDEDDANRLESRCCKLREVVPRVIPSYVLLRRYIRTYPSRLRLVFSPKSNIKYYSNEKIRIEDTIQ
ncbi:PH and SEC7 domain-containing protein isoform X5 [Vespula maculifrons]|uniref:PH and SEC7 domain-containing protein isoform X5 n=1 Tax=Vespula maculifrons TaxID=7453 RepID=A0ABD2C5I8_VESMC